MTSFFFGRSWIGSRRPLPTTDTLSLSSSSSVASALLSCSFLSFLLQRNHPASCQCRMGAVRYATRGARATRHPPHGRAVAPPTTATHTRHQQRIVKHDDGAAVMDVVLQLAARCYNKRCYIQWHGMLQSTNFFAGTNYWSFLLKFCLLEPMLFFLLEPTICFVSTD